MPKIIIFDTTLRDGEQSPGASLTTQEKVLIAKQLVKLGVDVIEAGFPISSDGDFESVRLIANEVRDAVVCGLARTKREDVDRAWEAIRTAKKPRIHVFVATSEIHMENKLRKSKEEILRMVSESVGHARSLCNDVEFSPEDATRTDMDYMCDVVKVAIESGATTINIPDTVGYAQPEEFGRRIRYVFGKLGKLIEKNGVVVSAHCHDDLGLALSNSLEAVRSGATQIECTINGIGERAGNCSLEEFVMNLKTRSDFFKDFQTTIDTKEIFRTSRLVSSLTGMVVQRNKAIVGENAFAHEAGIHQHGVLASRLTYEIMKPEDIGWEGTNIIIGKHSGRHAIETVLKDMGYGFSGDQIERVMDKVKELADKQKSVMKEDVIAIASDIAGNLSKEKEIVRLDEVKVVAGNKMKPEATVTLIINGERKTGRGTGVGPVDAISNAMKSIIDPSISLKEYHMNSITGGTNALASVSIKIQDGKGNVFKAEAVDEDIVMASTIALVEGANRALNFQKNGIRKQGIDHHL